MEIPGYEDTFFDNIDEDIKRQFYSAKQKFQETRENNIARNEEVARKSRISNERSKFISHCIKLSDAKKNINVSDETTTTVDN